MDRVILDALACDVQTCVVSWVATADLPALSDLERPQALMLANDSAALVVDRSWIRSNVLICLINADRDAKSAGCGGRSIQRWVKERRKALHALRNSLNFCLGSTKQRPIDSLRLTVCKPCSAAMRRTSDLWRWPRGKTAWAHRTNSRSSWCQYTETPCADTTGNRDRFALTLLSFASGTDDRKRDWSFEMSTACNIRVCPGTERSMRA